MRKGFPLFMALGAGLAFVTVYNRLHHQANARQWNQQRALELAEDRPGTAFITGASSGIGAEFARQLARQGYNLVLLARREDRLTALAAELRKLDRVNIETLVADLSDPADVERAAIRVGEIPDLDLLVNNAGFGHGGTFVEIDPQEELRMIRVHVEASVRLARAALPGMIARGRGGVINVSSLAGLIPAPGSHTYGATKSYLNFFSEVLSYELAGTGVRVEALCPGFTYTEIHKTGRPKLPSFLWLDPEVVVAESLDGLREGQLVVVPGVVYKVIAGFITNPLVRPLAHFVQSRGWSRWAVRAVRTG